MVTIDRVTSKVITGTPESQDRHFNPSGTAENLAWNYNGWMTVFSRKPALFLDDARQGQDCVEIVNSRSLMKRCIMQFPTLDDLEWPLYIMRLKSAKGALFQPSW